MSITRECNLSREDLSPPSEIESHVDHREQLFNDGKSGPIEEIQVSTERITILKGILFDLDPHLFTKSVLIPKLYRKPPNFYKKIAKPWLNRDPVLSRAEVRNSGRGLHVILRFRDPLIFTTDRERNRWAGVIDVIQTALPIDPDQPGITAVTRPLGSINGKNNEKVTCLNTGESVTAEDVLKLYEQMKSASFRTVMRILTGEATLTPCPLCGKAETRLTALDHVGRCYGSCGTVKLQQLYDLVLAPRPSLGMGVADDKK